MGYQITFLPTEEKMNTYKPWNDRVVNYEEAIKNTKRELISYCLKDHEDEDTMKIATNIGFQLRMLISNIELNEKFIAYKRWSEDDEHELWYCGWQFSHPCEIDKDSILENTIDELTILADVVKTPDYFDDIDKFDRKRIAIAEQLDDFAETMSDIAIYSIIEDLREFEEKYDEETPADKNVVQQETFGIFGHPIRTEDDIKELLAGGNGKVEINPVNDIMKKVKEQETKNSENLDPVEYADDFTTLREIKKN